MEMPKGQKTKTRKGGKALIDVGRKKAPKGAPKFFRYRRTKAEIEKDKMNKKAFKDSHKESSEQEDKLHAEKKIDLQKLYSKRITEQKIEKALFELVSTTTITGTHEYLIKTFGTAHQALVMGYLLRCEYRTSTEGNPWFCTTYADIERYTGILKRTMANTIIRQLRVSGLIETKMVGVPAKMHYRIDKDLLLDLIYESNPPKGFRDILAGKVE